MTTRYDELVERLRIWGSTVENEADEDFLRAADAIEALQQQAAEQTEISLANLNMLDAARAALAAEKLKRQQAEHERDSILEDLAAAQGPREITETMVYRVCAYLKETCKQCPSRIVVEGYGSGVQGCYAIAHETIDVVLAALAAHGEKP